MILGSPDIEQGNALSLRHAPPGRRQRGNTLATNADGGNFSVALDALGRPGNTGEFARAYVVSGVPNPLSRQ